MSFQKKKLVSMQEGFTLVELIVVITIISILIAVLTPQYIQYVTKSREAVCLNNRDALVRQYNIDLVAYESGMSDVSFNENASTLQVAYNILTDSAKSDDLTVTGSGPLVIKGLCPSNGDCTATIDASTLLCSIVCAEHSDTTTTNYIPPSYTKVSNLIAANWASWSTATSGLALIALYWEANGGIPEALTADEKSAIFGANALYNPGSLAWSANKITVGGTSSYLMFVGNVTTANPNASWNAYSVVYNGVTYVSTKHVTWGNKGIDTSSISQNSFTNSSAVLTYLTNQGFTPIS